MANNKETIKAVLDLVNSVDFVQVLEIAEMVASFAPIPGLAAIIKVLRMLVKVQPQIKMGTNAASKILEYQSNKEE